MEQSDLTTCRNVRYTKGWRKGASKCEQCGFWFVPDSQRYPLDDSEPVEYLTGVQWFAQFKCCPNCLPAESAAPFGKRRCIGKRTFGTWNKKRGCGIWLIVPSRHHTKHEKCHNNTRKQNCDACNSRFLKPASAIGIIRIGKELAKTLKRTPTRAEWKDAIKHPCVSTVERQFGSWSTFILVLGEHPRKQSEATRRNTGMFVKSYSDKMILDSMSQVFKKYGRALSIPEWINLKLKPSCNTIYLRFGWRRAWELIGAKPFPNPGLDKEWARAHITEAILNKRQPLPPTARDMWLASHDQASESTKQYLAAVQHHTEKLDEQERIFKEHQFKKKDSVDIDDDS